MRIAFCLLMDLLGAALCLVYPFLAVLRAKGFARPILLGWLGILLWCLWFSLGVPRIVHLFDRGFAREMQLNWVPEPKGILPIALLGWWPPLMAALLALRARRLLAGRFPEHQ